MLHVVHLIERRRGRRAPYVALFLVLLASLALAAGAALLAR
ncbi:hypothetical protein [Pseudoxanthomonas suwonensis]|nr:hypothetical protein [Pseudoxanthomonas suwonensis]